MAVRPWPADVGRAERVRGMYAGGGAASALANLLSERYHGMPVAAHCRIEPWEAPRWPRRRQKSTTLTTATSCPQEGTQLGILYSPVSR